MYIWLRAGSEMDSERLKMWLVCHSVDGLWFAYIAIWQNGKMSAMCITGNDIGDHMETPANLFTLQQWLRHYKTINSLRGPCLEIKRINKCITLGLCTGL